MIETRAHERTGCTPLGSWPVTAWGHARFEFALSRREDDQHMRWCVLVLVVIALTLSAVALGSSTQEPSGPLIGMNYTELAKQGACGRRYIVRHGHEFGARTAMKAQLAAMRAAGVEILRFFIWHDHAGAAFEAIPSAGGRLVEPYRSNFIAYLRAARALGFKRVEIVFGPVLGNDPMAIYGGVPYDPALFDENWSLIQDVRSITKENGPPSRFDLLNEGAPSDGQVLKPQILEYLADLYRRYVDTYGNEDVTISMIYTHRDPSRLPNLLEAIHMSERPFPTFFEVHVDYASRDALRDLHEVDQALTAADLRQPLELGEGPYNNADFAETVASFVHQSARPVTDVMAWPLEYLSSCRDFSVAPPYRVSEYIRALKGAAAWSATTSLTGAVTARGIPSLTNGAGLVATALENDTYRVKVSDRSRVQGFELKGPRFDKRTGERFRGSVSWRVRLKPGRYSFGTTGAVHRSFDVLRAR